MRRYKSEVKRGRPSYLTDIHKNDSEIQANIGTENSYPWNINSDILIR